MNFKPYLTAALLALRSCTPEPVFAATHPQLPAHEAAILTAVAHEYGLSDWQTKILLAIRLVENGGPGHEMGVENKRARRAGLYIQALWAAGTIKKRCPTPEHFTELAMRYCPYNWEWWRKTVAEKAAGVKL
jgi:hypothetical protein